VYGFTASSLIPTVSIGDKVVSAIEWKNKDGSSISPGSKGVVIGPSTDTSAADSDKRVSVQFDGMKANMVAATQIKSE